MADEESGLRRWSRRKAKAQAGAEEAERPEPEAAPQVPETEIPGPAMSAGAVAAVPDPDQTDAVPEAADEEAVPEDLPDVESLDKDSDFSIFMREDVPQKIRNMALRKLWLSDPAFNVMDGLVEYGEDFTKDAPILGSIYQVGKGYMTKEDEAAEDETEDGTEDGKEGETGAEAADGAPAETADGTEDGKEGETGAEAADGAPTETADGTEAETADGAPAETAAGDDAGAADEDGDSVIAEKELPAETPAET